MLSAPAKVAASFISSSVLSSSSLLFFTKPLVNGQLRMSHNHNNVGETEHKQTTTEVDKVQRFILLDHNGGWEECWKQGVTPWDLRQPTPVLLHLHRTDALPKGRALIPGCGSGHDVVAIACPDRYVIGLDISEKAIQKAKETDFFTWQPMELFDLIFDYTFFCAIEPDMRTLWANKIRDLLKPDGELITLIFPISDHEGGPPYRVCVADYEEVLSPMGFKPMSIVDNELAVAPRRGREKLARWKRLMCESRL